MLSRRAFTAGLASLTVAPRPARAQSAAKRARIDIILFGTPATETNLPALLAGLADLGWTESKNLTIEYRNAEGRPDRVAGLAAAAVAAAPDVIVVIGGDIAPFVRDATRRIPIVMLVSNDPVEAGLVPRLNQPGGNLTGVAFPSDEIAGKRLQLLREAAPGVSRVGVLWNPDHPDGEFRNTRAAARDLRMHAHSIEVRQPAEFDAAFQAATRERVDALFVASSRFMHLNLARVLEYVTRQRIPLIASWGPWVRAGALMSYGPDLADLVRRSATHVSKILRGARPGDLPIEQPTKFQLVLNRKTASALGLTLPPSLLLRADEVVD
jgi:putative ABC transport system substrate-binding protein